MGFGEYKENLAIAFLERGIYNDNKNRTNVRKKEGRKWIEQYCIQIVIAFMLALNCCIIQNWKASQLL